jgi:hypothetical protein
MSCGNIMVGCFGQDVADLSTARQVGSLVLMARRFSVTI